MMQTDKKTRRRLSRLRFSHEFAGGARAQITFPRDSGKIQIVWTSQPTKDVLPEYLKWIQSVVDSVWDSIGVRIVHVIPLGTGAFVIVPTAERQKQPPNEPIATTAEGTR